MIVNLFSKIRAGQSFNCPFFSSTRMKVFLSMKEKRKITSKAFAAAKNNITKVQHPAGSYYAAGNVILTLKQPRWLPFQQQQLQNPQ